MAPQYENAFPFPKIGSLHADCTCSKALLLGAGFVVKPTLTLLSEKGVEVTVGMDEHERRSRGIQLTSGSLPNPRERAEDMQGRQGHHRDSARCRERKSTR